jgi:nucleoid-associated protein YgaU
VLKIPGVVPTPSRPVVNAVAAKPVQKTHRVGTGDTLTSIASTHYGDSSRWNDIFVANKKVLGGNPDQLRVDVVLLIP